MDPVLGSIIGGATVALITGGLAWWQTRDVESERSKVAANTSAMETVKIQIDGWDRLADSYRQEISRLNAALAEERAIAEAFASKADRLEGELHESRGEVEFCRTHHRPQEVPGEG